MTEFFFFFLTTIFSGVLCVYSDPEYGVVSAPRVWRTCARGAWTTTPKVCIVVHAGAVRSQCTWKQ